MDACRSEAYNRDVDQKVLDRLRQAQALHELPDGREGIDVTLQFVGKVPQVGRAERKEWLASRFSSANNHLSEAVALEPQSLSTSAQSIQAVVPVTAFDSIRQQLSADEIRVEVVQTYQVVERTD